MKLSEVDAAAKHQLRRTDKAEYDRLRAQLMRDGAADWDITSTLKGFIWEKIEEYEVLQ